MRHASHRSLRVALLLLVAAAPLARPGRLAAQQERVLPALLGGALGLGVGGYVSIGIWSYKAHHGEYLFSVKDALGWESTPILVGTAIGATVGWISRDRLRRSAEIGLGLGAVGTVVGAVVGKRVWTTPEGMWGGGVIGGGAGLVVGALVGMFWPTGGGGGGGVPVQIRVPVGF